MTTPGWSVLLITGASGTGKTTVAKTLSRELGVAWVQVDDLRLALQYSDARLPDQAATDDLHFFLRQPDIWSLPAERLAGALVAIGQAMTEAIAVVAGNHIAQGDPAVIEGDGILPGLLDHPDLRGFVASGALRMAVLAPGSEAELLASMIGRGRGEHLDPETPQARKIAAMNWRFSRWLVADAGAHGVPVIPTRPWETLAWRIVRSLGNGEE